MLYLIPAPLGDTYTNVLTEDALAIVRTIKTFVVERGKTARRFLKAYGATIPLQEMTFFELNKRTEAVELPLFLEAAKRGEAVGLISEAGCPGVADPGAQLVALAHRLDIPVRPLIGPSSLLLALMASGMNGQQFAFQGYLPIKQPARSKRLQTLERRALQGETQLFIETPYRNVSLLEDIKKSLSASTRLCIAVDMTLPTEWVHTTTVGAWQVNAERLHKRPAVFLLGQ